MACPPPKIRLGYVYKIQALGHNNNAHHVRCQQDNAYNMQVYLMSFKERLLALRKKLNLTQAQFAKPLGVNRGYIATLETSDKEPSKTLLKLISYEYCISYTWLKTGEGEMFISPEESLKKIIACYGEQAIVEAFRSIQISKETSIDIIDATGFPRRAYDKEPELKRMVDTLHAIFSAGDEKLKNWASVQFDIAIPKHIVEEVQKKQQETTRQASAG